MAYRKVEVNGKTYEYTVGRTHVKIKGIGAPFKDEVGREYGDDKTLVKPSHIRAYIEKNI